MPLNAKGRTIMQAMRQQYGNRAERVFYGARNAGTIGGVDRRSPVDGMPGRDGGQAAAGRAARGAAAPPRRPVVRRRN